jgi:hypothetical protein
MARLEQLRPGVRVRHNSGSPTLAGCTGTVRERTRGHYIDTSLSNVGVWVVWDNPGRLAHLAPGWSDIDFLEVIRR